MERSRRMSTGREVDHVPAVLLVVVGTFNVINGIALIVDDNYFHADELLFGDLSTWGWLALIMGAGQILIGFGIFSGNILAQVLAVVWAMPERVPPSLRNRCVPGVVDHHHGNRRTRDLWADHVRTGIGPRA